MNEPQIHALAERVGRLERENRRLKRMGGAVASAACLALLMGQAAPKSNVIQAQRFVVTDDSGAERIILSAAKDQAHIMLKNDSGKASAVLAVAPASAGFTIMDENGKIRVNLGKDMRPGGGAGLWLYDDQGTPRYAAGVDRRGPSIVQYDENGRRVP